MGDILSIKINNCSFIDKMLKFREADFILDRICING